MTDVCDYIYKAAFPTWEDKELILKKLKSCLVYVAVQHNKIEGICLLETQDYLQFHCCLLITDSTDAIKTLILMFKTEFPFGKITTAHRRSKLISYRNPDKLLSKFLKLF